MIWSFTENLKFSKFGFAIIKPVMANRKDFLRNLSYKNKKNLLIKDRKDAGALKVKENLQKNYKLYADLLLSEFKNAEQLVKEKIYPYVVMHILNDKKQELIWHRD